MMQRERGRQQPKGQSQGQGRRAAALERIADYHARQQEQLLQPVLDAADRYRRGEADVWDVDAAITAYQKAGQELYVKMSTFYKSSVPLHFLLEFLDRDARGDDPWGFLMEEWQRKPR